MPKIVGMFSDSFDFSQTVGHISKNGGSVLDDERIKDSFDELVKMPYVDALIDQMKQSPFFVSKTENDSKDIQIQ